MNPSWRANLVSISAAMLIVLIASADCLAQAAPAGGAATDAQVDLAIRRGLDYLTACRGQGGTYDTRYKDQFPGGAEALVAAAALSAGVSPEDESIRPVIDEALKANPQTTYARAARVLMLSKLNQKDFGTRLAEDVSFLLRLQNISGGWGYGMGHPTSKDQPKWTDNSNSQLAILALTEAAGAGAKVPTAVWKTSLAYWVRTQNKDGGWGYEPAGGTTPPVRRSSYGSMSAAGLASMLTLDQRLSAIEPAAARSADDAIIKASKWVSDNYTVRSIPQWTWAPGDIYNDYYFIYAHALARASAAAGLRVVGTAGQWRSDMAAFLVSRQQPDGSWLEPTASVNMDAPKDAPIRTSFAIMTLAELRSPPLVSRIAVTPGNEYDAANMVAYVSRALNWPLTWQGLAPQQADLLSEAPIAYISGPFGLWSKQAGIISPEVAAAIRQYVLAGGLVLVNPTDDKAAKTATEYLSSLLPELKVAPLADDHPVYTASVNIPAAGRVKITGMSDSTRTAVFILDKDLSGSWQASQASQQAAFDFAVNLALYATDGVRPSGVLTRMRQGTIGAQAPLREIHVARLRGGGDWNVCPTAIAKLDEVLSRSMSVGVKEDDAIDLSADVPEAVAVLWVTGSSLPELSAAQRDRLKKFVAGGGMVFIDPSAGQKDFFDAACSVVKDIFGASSLKAIASDDAFVTGRFSESAADFSTVSYSPAVLKTQPGLKKPVLFGVESQPGRWGVVISPYAVTCPLSGVRAYGIQSYSQPDAGRLVANVVLYSQK